MSSEGKTIFTGPKFRTHVSGWGRNEVMFVQPNIVTRADAVFLEVILFKTDKPGDDVNRKLIQMRTLDVIGCWRAGMILGEIKKLNEWHPRSACTAASRAVLTDDPELRMHINEIRFLIDEESLSRIMTTQVPPQIMELIFARELARESNDATAIWNEHEAGTLSWDPRLASFGIPAPTAIPAQQPLSLPSA
ncbi:MAG: hypothetical protein HZC02_02620 [Candidatus Levybacteria bacterium]|nr:hypothetical protein [Candidatus Levybacteria bacterium]